MIYSLFGRSGNRIPRWSGRRLRRTLCLSAVVSLALSWALIWTPFQGTALHSTLFWALPVMMRLLELSTADAIYRRGEFLDERQRDLRNYAFCVSLRTIQILLFALVIWIFIRSATSGFSFSTDGLIFGAFLMTVYALVWAAPTLLMAWLEPDTLLDD